MQTDLNISDLPELLQHQPSLTQEQQDRLHVIQYKAAAFPDKFARPHDHYLEHSAIIAMSDWHMAHEFCFCYIRRHHCRQWKLCPLCSYRKKQRTLAAYLPRFTKTNWLFMTISFNGSLAFEVYDDIPLYWDACRHALDQLVDTGAIRGAVWREELALLGFMPLRVVPHVHALVDADWLDEDLIAQFVQDYRRPYGSDGETSDPVDLLPSIDVKPIESARTFANILSYANKCLDLSTPYKLAWPKAAADNRRLVWQLHEDVEQFLNGFACETQGRHQVRYRGTLHFKHRNFVGVPKAKRSWVQVQALLAAHPPQFGAN